MASLRFRCAVVCVGCLVLIQIWYNITCFVFVQACSPLGIGRMARLILNLDTMPVHHSASSALRSTAGGDGLAQCTPMWREGEDPRWAILLASPKSGSTYVQQMLNSHPMITFGRERILEIYRECRVRAEGHCGWNETRASLERVFYGYRKEPWYQQKKVVGFKIQYDHIASELRPEFARWLACNQVDVLHLCRGAVVESFWTLQAEVLDTLQLKGDEKVLQVNANKTNARPEHLDSNHQPISLDPAKAAEYVRAVEGQRADYRQLLLYGSARVAYLELHYETLLSGRPGALEWDAALAFLGLAQVGSHRCQGKPLAPGTSGSAGSLLKRLCTVRDMSSATIKVHPGGCATKIENWAEVRAALEGTDTLVACDSQQAMVALAGEVTTQKS